MHGLAPSGRSLQSWTFSFLVSIIACHSLTRVAPQTTFSPAELRSELASCRPPTRTNRRLSLPPLQDTFTPSLFLFLHYEIHYKEKEIFVNIFFETDSRFTVRFSCIRFLSRKNIQRDKPCANHESLIRHPMPR